MGTNPVGNLLHTGSHILVLFEVHKLFSSELFGKLRLLRAAIHNDWPHAHSPGKGISILHATLCTFNAHFANCTP